jgi:hypothetical protein
MEMRRLLVVCRCGLMMMSRIVSVGHNYILSPPDPTLDATTTVMPGLVAEYTYWLVLAAKRLER